MAIRHGIYIIIQRNIFFRQYYNRLHLSNYVTLNRVKGLKNIAYTGWDESKSELGLIF